jgi:hypothetical protein
MFELVKLSARMFMIDRLIVSLVEVSILLGYDATILDIWFLTF